MTKFRCRVATVTVGLGIGLGGPGSVASAQAPAPVARRAEAVATTANSAAGARGESLTGRINPATGVVAADPRALIRVDGVVAPGLRVTLDGSGSSGGRVWYRWVQTQGTRVNLRTPDQVTTTFVVPQEATTLGFVLVVGNDSGVDARPITLTTQELERDTEETPLQADAGVDQSGTIGRKVILDGSRSEPQGRFRSRWVQVGGPKTTIQTGGNLCTFTPEAAGTYQFALIVLGSNNIASEPALVTVRVRSAVQSTGTGPVDRSSMALDEFGRTALLTLPGGPGYAPDLARAFDATADRLDSPRTYAEVIGDLVGRLDAVIPRDPKKRGAWVVDVFNPWTAQVARRMQEGGIDLGRVENQFRPLNRAQRARLAEQLRLTAAGFRATTITR